MRTHLSRLVAVIVLGLAVAAVPRAHAGFVLGDAANFTLMYEGNGSNQLSATNVTINGNIGIGAPSGGTTAGLKVSASTTINGNVLFAGAVKDSLSNATVTGTITGNNANVQTDLNNLNKLSSALGKETGTALSVSLGSKGQSQTVNASAGTLDKNGNRVFTVNSFSFAKGATLVINGDAAGDSVVLNFSGNAQFGGTIQLTGGLTSDQVLFNFTGNDALSFNGQGAQVAGSFLDTNGKISVKNTTIDGRIFGGGGGDMSIDRGDTHYGPEAPSVTPEPSTMAMLVSGLAAIGLVGVRRFRKVRAG
jgi:choice-of-anchor A domain-containing protein